MTIKQAKDLLANELLFGGKYPNVQGVGIIEKKGNPAIEIMLLKGGDHSAVCRLFPDKKYGGYPISFIETAQIVAL